MVEDPVLAFTGGGTGGHVFPALAVIEELKDRGYDRFLWIGSSGGVEREIVEGAGIPYAAVPAGKLRRYISLRNITDLFRIVAAFFASRAILREHQPALLFSKGGFVSVPPAAAARSLGIPVISHESDFDPGLATRLNLRFSARVITAYPETAEALGGTGCGVEVLGNPIRLAIRRGRREDAAAHLPVDLNRPLLVVAGGSLGAVQLNEIVAAELPRLTELFSVVHQRGDHPAAAEESEFYHSRPFFSDEWGAILARADLLLCRGGASTLWEAAVSGTPAVVVPLSARASRGDQIRNARYFESRGAVVAIEEDPPEANVVVSQLLALYSDKERYNAARKAMASLAAGDVTAAIADLLEQTLGGKERK